MASISPSPNSPSSAIPPASSNSSPPLPSPPPTDPPRGTPPEPSNAPPPQLNSPPPTTTSPPPQSPPPTVVTLSPPPLTPPPTTSPPPRSMPSTPPANEPPTSSRPPSSSPPPLTSTPPTSSPPVSSPPLPSPPSDPPTRPPPSRPFPSNPPASPPTSPSRPPAGLPLPPPLTNPSLSPPPPQSSVPLASPPLKQPTPPRNDPPLPPSKPPESSPPPPFTRPPLNSPPPSTKPPEHSSPQPAAKPPQNSLPLPAPLSPKSSPPTRPSEPPKKYPPRLLIPPPHSPPASPPSSNSFQRSPPPPSLVSSPNGTNNSGTNAPESSHSAGGGGIGNGGIIAIVSVVVLLLLAIFALLGWCIWKRKKKASSLGGGSYIMPTSLVSPPKSDPNLLKVQISSPINRNGSGSGFENSPHTPSGLGNSRSWFTYEELVEATNGFSEQNLLGEGGFGSVYKGSLADSRVVAVKQLKIDGGQGEREFRSEVEIISRIHHRHLVSLVGYCISENRRLLVYDYVPNNTLYFHLHGEARPLLDWATRVKIAVGAARGIAYLHEDCHPRIIHRDIKSSNILLDDNFDARVSDFGLAKLAMDTNTHITTRVMGTFGYMAPEYATSGKLTEKSDVFSYGVVLLELITGCKPVDTSRPLGEESLVEWARPLLSHALETEEFGDVADSRLEGNYVGSEMFRMIEAAAVCVRHSAAKRPKMGQVVRAFDSITTSDLTNGMKVGASEIFNSAEQSAEIRLFRRMAFGSHNYSTDFFSQDSRSSERHFVNSH